VIGKSMVISGVGPWGQVALSIKPRDHGCKPPSHQLPDMSRIFNRTPPENEPKEAFEIYEYRAVEIEIELLESKY
jgi:hypothetical protein